jgi:hypothetical protein
MTAKREDLENMLRFSGKGVGWMIFVREGPPSIKDYSYSFGLPMTRDTENNPYSRKLFDMRCMFLGEPSDDTDDAPLHSSSFPSWDISPPFSSSRRPLDKLSNIHWFFAVQKLVVN